MTLYAVVFVLFFAMYAIGYAFGKKCKPETIGELIAVEDPVDHEVYLSASFKRHEDIDGLHNGDIVSFRVQRK